MQVGGEGGLEVLQTFDSVLSGRRVARIIGTVIEKPNFGDSELSKDGPCLEAKLLQCAPEAADRTCYRCKAAVSSCRRRCRQKDDHRCRLRSSPDRAACIVVIRLFRAACSPGLLEARGAEGPSARPGTTWYSRARRFP